MGYFFIAVLLGLIPAVIAQRKGRSFVGWWLFGALLFIVALPAALLIKPDQKEIAARAIEAGGRKCPHCAEIIKAEAVVCKHCGRDVPPLPDNVCRNCGAELRDGAWACKHCGTRVKT